MRARPLACAAVLVALCAAPEPARAVVGGTETQRSWPFMSYLELGVEPVNFGEAGLCGASLVAPTFVLTAAHCVMEEEARYPAAALTVVVGRHDRTATATGERIGVRDVLVHEGYDGEANRNDVALLELARPSTLAPIRVAGPGEETAFAPGVTATVLGWGFEYFEQPLPPDRLREAPLVVRDGADCPREGYEPATDVCTRGPEGQAVCFGDSGGPLVAAAPDGSLRLVGVVSWMDFEEDPCEVGSWSFFMRVGAPPLRDWLAARVPEAIAPPYAPPAPAPAQPAAAAGPPAARERPAKRRAARRRAACRRRAAGLRGRKRARALRRCERRKSRARGAFLRP